MESRKTRNLLKAFPPELAFTQDPADDLRKAIDIAGRMLQEAETFVTDQTNNLWPVYSDPNEPSGAYASGVTLSSNTTITGNQVETLDELTTQEVTGFVLEGSGIVEGVSGSGLAGCSYAQSPVGSGVLYVSTYGENKVWSMPWLTHTVTASGDLGIVHQDYIHQGEDEYLIIDKQIPTNPSGLLQYEPVPGSLVIIDAKNLMYPWDPTSDGITVPATDYTASGTILLLENPRPSYNPSIASGTATVYPIGYQPDLDWSSSFILEYDRVATETPHGLSQPVTRHNLGQMATPIFAGEDL